MKNIIRIFWLLQNTTGLFVTQLSLDSMDSDLESELYDLKEYYFNWDLTEAKCFMPL